MRTALLPILAVFLTFSAGCQPAPEAPPAEATTGAEAAPESTLVGEEVSYSSGGVNLKGYLAYDSAITGQRPGVIVVHEWWGHNEYVRERARKLAEMGYTALAIDMYGDGKNTEHAADAKAFMTQALADMDGAKARFEAGLELLKAHATTADDRTAAIGYCFGGAVVLHMARFGVDLDAVASFHGSLGTQTPAEPGAIGPELLVLTGAADPMVPPDAVAAFEREMAEAGARLEVVSYPGAVHAFTNPGATALGKANGLPLAHDPAADADSWKRLEAMLARTFAAPEPTAEAKKRAAREAKNRGDFARMEAASREEAARWTDALRAEAKTLAETRWRSTRAALKKILAGAHRAPGNAERDAHRHPRKTLDFFGVKPGMTVFEYGPGAGWYTELLAPLLAAKGRLIVNNGDPGGPREARPTYYAKRFQNFVDRAPEVYGKLQVVQVAGAPTLAPTVADGTVDMALVIRGAHGWERRGQTGAWLTELHRMLKPRGVLGVVQHRAPDGGEPAAWVKKGRWPEKALIARIEAAGFKLKGKSEINANSRDAKDQPAGVWTLPPTLRLGEQDREKYVAVGESDRMTLKFVKVKKSAQTPGAKTPGAKKQEANKPSAKATAKPPAPPVDKPAVPKPAPAK